MSILLDAGPALNFLAVSQQNILVQLAQSRELQLAAPQRVDTEVRGKTRDARFTGTAVLGTWTKMTAAGRIKVLDDGLADRAEFTAAVTRVSGMPAEQRVRAPASLGEIMVLAHASELAQQGQDIFVLIDDSDGRQRAKKEQRWLVEHKAPGALTLWSTPMVLRFAAAEDWIVNDRSWEQVYDAMRAYDDGLPARRS